MLRIALVYRPLRWCKALVTSLFANKSDASFIARLMALPLSIIDGYIGSSLVSFGNVPNRSSVGVNPSGPAVSLIALTAIYRTNYLFSSGRSS